MKHLEARAGKSGSLTPPGGQNPRVLTFAVRMLTRALPRLRLVGGAPDYIGVAAWLYLGDSNDRFPPATTKNGRVTQLSWVGNTGLQPPYNTLSSEERWLSSYLVKTSPQAKVEVARCPIPR